MMDEMDRVSKHLLLSTWKKMDKEKAKNETWRLSNLVLLELAPCSKRTTGINNTINDNNTYHPGRTVFIYLFIYLLIYFHLPADG